MNGIVFIATSSLIYLYWHLFDQHMRLFRLEYSVLGLDIFGEGEILM